MLVRICAVSNTLVRWPTKTDPHRILLKPIEIQQKIAEKNQTVTPVFWDIYISFQSISLHFTPFHRFSSLYIYIYPHLIFPPYGCP